MKKLLLLIVILLSVSNFLNAQSCATSAGWTTMASIPGATFGSPNYNTNPTSMRNSSFAFSIGNKGYIGGGQYPISGQFATVAAYFRSDFWEYDPFSNAWSQKADIINSYSVNASNTYSATTNNGGIIEARGFSVGGKGYFIGGRTRNNSGGITYSGYFQEYDPVNNTWTNRANALSSACDLVYCKAPATFTINGVAYVGSAQTSSNTANGCYYNNNAVYNVSRKWYRFDQNTMTFSSIPDYPGTLQVNPVGFGGKNKGFLIEKNELWKYNDTTNTWTNTLGNYANNVYTNNQAAFTIGDYAYIGGGFTESNNYGSANFYEYNMVQEKFSGAQSSSNNIGATTWNIPWSSGLSEIAAFSIGNKGYFYGGVSGANNGYQINGALYEFTPQGSQKNIRTDLLVPTNLCKGSTFNIQATDYPCYNSFPSNNVFTAQLSDANGFFSNASPTVIGTSTASSSYYSIFSATIPSSTPSGSRYRIRVVASSPYTISYDNGNPITISDPGSAGTISHPYSVPYPSELASDQIASSAAASGVSSYLWQSSTDNSSWTTIPGADQATYPLPGTNQNDIYFRRGANLACLATVYTAPVQLRVYSASNNRLNGTISGTVRSNNGVGVYGITITAQKNVGLSGSPQSKTYTTTTDQTGAYTIPNIFYGDLNNGDPSSVAFTITPSKSGHTFTPATNTATLSLSIPSVGSKDFTDLATYSVAGKVTQTCASCEVGFQTDSLNGVQLGVTKNGVILPSSTTGASVYGRYANTFTDPGTYKFTPSKTGHRFNPGQQDVTISNTDVSGINFADTTQYTISGMLRAGANEIIGSAQLEFTDTVAGRTTKFKKIVNTSLDGSFSVTLPARKYKMRMNTFTPTGLGADIAVNDLLTWFNTTLKDSSYINIDTSNQTYNLTYHRAPVLVIDNLPDTSCGNYIVFKQDEAKAFTVKVYEGTTLHNCLLSYDSVSTVKINTNVHVKDVNQILSYTPVNGLAQVQLLGGSPNIVAPYDKFFNVNYTDRYNRVATNLSRNVKVLGLTADPGTFTTVSPSVPILILHAPPGDQSTSFWEQTQTTETAMRFSALTDKTRGAFAEVKIGAKFETGIGFVTESSVWANASASISNRQTVKNATEAILSSSTTVGYATQPNGGDVYVGGAMNLCYSVAHEIQYASGCTLGIKNSLAVAPKGFATTYTYSESFITETLIPSLQFIADNNSDSSSKYTNQIKVWEQVIANNNANKDRAEFVRNRSFDGNAGPITESTTSSSTQSSSLEFEVEIDRSMAISAGVEIGGSGFNGGVNIDLKMTTGNSSTNTNTSSTTMGYTLDDDDAGDYFSVDVKKDPVYNTPVFVLVAGTASCPAEPIAQSRDNVQLSIPTPEIRNIPGNGEALFQLHLQNTSESRETRTYFLTFNQSSNPNGALVTIGGSPVTSNISYTIPYLGSQTVTVAVRKSASSNIYSYEGLEFTLSDACEGGVAKSNTISAYFQSPCSDLILNAPVNNWVAKSSNNNILPVEFTGYNLSNLQSVALEYAHAGRGDWRTDTTIYQNFISNPTSSILNWNIARIADGSYDIRMKLNCVSGSGYTQRLSGIIDREAPSLFGLPQPTDRSYISGDEISMSYSENLQTNNLNTNKVTMTRMLDGTDIPVQVSGYQNKVMIVPLTNINSFATSEVIRVVSKQIADIYGNESAVSDTFLFNVGASVATNSNRKVTLSNVVATKRAIFENSGDSLQIKFSVPTASAFNTVVHYLVSGSAAFESDYNNSFSSGQNLTTEFNGTQGTINIPANATSAILRIKPIADDELEANETVKIRLLSGGDYKLGADSLIVITDTIKNDDLNQPEITMGDIPRTAPTGYCATVTDNNLAKPYVWNVPTTLPAGYCTTLMDYASIRPYVWNVPTTLPAGYCAIQMDNSLVKTNSTPTEVIPTTLPTGYCYAESSSMGDEQIFAVNFGSMNNVQAENCTTGYTDYSASITPTTVYLNETVPFSVLTDECDGSWYYSSGMSIFIDYNRDGIFDDATEKIYTTNGVTASPNTRSGNVVIPSSATLGLTKMRVVVSEMVASPGSCGEMGYGEVEDYAVMILKPVPTLPTGYCYAEAPAMGDEQIYSVSFGSMNNVQNENCTTGYTDYSASIAPPTVHLNETVPFSVFTDECDGYYYYPSGMSIFIDYNRDGNFDENTEKAYTTNGTTTSPNTRSGNVVIPANATPGLTKMRVVVSESNLSPSSCGNMGYGEVEDYAVMIDASPAPSILTDEQIFAVTFGTMNNTQAENCSSNYTDYTSSITAPVVSVGETVPFSVLTNECDAAPYYASGMSVYIDYNRDGDFDDANEKAYTTSATTMSPNTRSGNITIPTDAAQGLTKMRIVVAEGVTSPGSCINLGYGEVEDYSIMIHGIPTPQSINDDQQIFAVSFGSMNNVQSENCSSNYTDYSSTVTAPVVTTGTYVPFSVLTDECDAAPYYSSGMSIFIDYNRDGDFDDSGEKAYTTNRTAISPNTRSGNIYIPTDATLGLTKMRVVVQEGDIAPASCISLGYGEVEDYAIMIHNVPPVQSVLDDEQIKAVSFGSMNNEQSDNCNTNYTDYSSSVTVPTVLFGESVPFSIVTDECDNAPYYTSGMSIFIDYNRDGDFNDLGEKAYTTNGTTMSPNTRSGEIVIPTNATRGLTKMRVVVAEGIASPDACIPMGYGEVEDYGVMIMDGAAAKICQGGTAVLSANDQIDGQPVYSYVWKLGNNIIGTSRNITINAAGTYSLKVYTANGFSGASIPYVVTATAPPTSDLYIAVCPSQLPYSWNGINYNTTGNYNRTISNANGCDSIVNLHFTVKSNSYYVETISAIDTFEWHGVVYDASTNAPIWTGTNATGCDSIVNLHLTIIPRCVPIERIYDIIACNAYTWHGIRFTNSVSGVEWTTLNYRGCDSTEILNLTINRSSTSTTNVSVCASQMPYLWNNTIYTTAGTYTKRFNNVVGCDSTAKLILVVKSLSSSITNVPVCANEMPYTWNGTVYNTGGTYVKTFANALGCDSTATLVLTVKPISNSNTNLSLCSNQLPFVWNGFTLTATGTYSKNFNNAYGCDSLATLYLTVKLVSNVTETVNVTGTSYTWHGTRFTTSNHSATWVGTNAAGCDSIVTLDLTLTNNCVPTQKTYNVTACNSYIWHGIRSTTSTTLEWVGVNAGGCDSIEVLYLTINNLSPTASPASITQTLVSNVCGARVYRYEATSVTNANGYAWTLPISVGGITGVVVDSGDVANSRILLVRYASTLAAFTTDSVKVKAFSACGSTANRSAKLINTLFTVPAAPASITITPIVTNVCVGKRYRFTAPSLPIATTTTVAASGYQWVFTGVLGASIDSGDVNSKVITVIFSSSAAAATGDSVKLCYTSTCGNGLYKASKLTNTLLATPAAPTVIVTAVQTTVCGARKYRYAASALPAATTTAAAANGWYWSLPAEGLVGITGTLDSGTVNSQVIVVSYTSNAAASAGDSIRVRFTSICGLGAEKATKLTNTALGVPATPTVTVTAVQTNVCSVRRYRYSASALSVATTTVGAASGWLWSLPEGPNGSTGTIDSGNVNSQTIIVAYTSNAAAVAGDTIRVRYTSGCGLGEVKATKLTNTVLGAPAAPASVTIALVSDICGARIYRYTVPALTAATTTTGAPTGYLWSMPFGTVGSTGVLDSGTVTSQVIRIRYSSNAVAATGDSIKVMYTSSCGNSPSKAQKLSNVAATILTAPSTLTGTTSICSVVGTATSNRYIASAVTGAVSYFWSIPTGAVIDSGSNGLKIKVRFLTAGANDSIYVQAVGTNGCYGTKKVLKLVTTGCVTPSYTRGESVPVKNTITDPMSVSIYPNPTTSNYQLFVKTKNVNTVIASVFDAQGRLMNTFKFNSTETIAFGNELKAGVYMVELIEGKEVKTVRVVKY